MLTLRRLLWLTMLSAALLAAADATGKWSGTVEINSNGEAKSEPAFLILKQDGMTLTGSGGPQEDHQFPMRNGKIDGERLTFEIPLGENAERVMSFNLTISGDSIQGEVSGPSKGGGTDKAKLSFKRVKAS